jgi:hypothetical protein
MYKITKKDTWNKKGVPTNWVKYLNVQTEQEVYLHYKKDEILKIEKIK